MHPELTQTGETSTNDDKAILGLGTVVVDHQVQVSKLPEADTKTTILASHHQVGGPVVTALALLGKWGYRPSFIGCWGTDDLGERIERDLIACHIESGMASVHPSHATGFAHVWVEAHTGRRSIAAYRGKECLSEEDLSDICWADWHHLHLDGWHGKLARLAAESMTQAGGTVSMDLGSPKPDLASLLKHVHALQCPESLLENLYPEQPSDEAAKRLLELGPEEIVVTQGERGAWLLNSNESFHQAAHEVAAIDTNGAGDVFAGAMIHGRIQGWHPVKRLQFAAACSGLKCQQMGNRASLPSLRQVEALL